MRRALVLPLVPSLLLVQALVAQDFAWRRQVQPGPPGPQRLEVDLALLGASRAGLADLRLQDRAGRELPYVLVPPAGAGPAWVRGRLLTLPPTRTSSGLELDLGRPVRAARLRLDGIPAPFSKRFRLDGSGDRAHWTELVPAGSLFDLPGDGQRLLTADFPEGEYRYLRLTWDDRASAPPGMPGSAWAAPAPQDAGNARLEPLPFRRLPAEAGVSRFALDLPGPRLPIRALVLEAAGAGPLLRDAEVTEPSLSGTGLAPRMQGRATLRRAPGSGTDALRIPIQAPEGSELDLKVADGANPPLALTGVLAELPPQPWIYFQTLDAAPLTALCGRAGLAAPRYDLQALDDRLGRARAAAAQWGPVAAPGPAGTAPAGLEPVPGAALDPGGFRWRRPVPSGPPGLVALVLDPAVLAASPGLQDLRLLDGSGRQVPYLLERRDEPLELALALPPGRTEARLTRYPLVLPALGGRPARLVLETAARVFSRAVRVRAEGAAEGQGVLAAAIWVHDQPETPAPPLELVLPALGQDRAVLEVDEGDNPPLPLGSARLQLPCWRLRFFQPADPVQLCYGQDLEAPRYDLALLARRLGDAPAREAVLAPPTADATAGPGPDRMRLAFWGVLVLAVATLLALLARLLKQPGQGAE
jgi:hypothetical protein